MDQDIEPIRHTLTAQLRFLEIYRDDVDRLLAMFHQSCQKVTISDSRHRYKTLDAMKANVPNPLRELNIQGENPGVSFMFNQMEMVRGAGTPMPSIFNELRTEETTDAADALFFKVKDFLTAFEQPSVNKGYVAGAVLGVVGMIWSLVSHTTEDPTGHGTVSRGALPGLFISLVVMGFCLSRGARFCGYLGEGEIVLFCLPVPLLSQGEPMKKSELYAALRNRTSPTRLLDIPLTNLHQSRKAATASLYPVARCARSGLGQRHNFSIT